MPGEATPSPRSPGTVEILANAQGIQRRFPPEEFPLEAWDEVLEINLTSVFGLCQLAGRVMLVSGHGKIVNIASLNSFTGGITIPAYSASKAGVAVLTKALSNDWAKRGITVNAIAPLEAWPKSSNAPEKWGGASPGSWFHGWPPENMSGSAQFWSCYPNAYSREALSGRASRP